jgi:excisionase family DNA binding protein
MGEQDVAAQAIERQTYSVDEAAIMLGISRWLAYELVKKGDLPTIPLGRRRLVPKSALDRILTIPDSRPAEPAEVS